MKKTTEKIGVGYVNQKRKEKEEKKNEGRREFSISDRYGGNEEK